MMRIELASERMTTGGGKPPIRDIIATAHISRACFGVHSAVTLHAGWPTNAMRHQMMGRQCHSATQKCVNFSRACAVSCSHIAHLFMPQLPKPIIPAASPHTGGQSVHRHPHPATLALPTVHVTRTLQERSSRHPRLDPPAVAVQGATWGAQACAVPPHNPTGPSPAEANSNKSMLRPSTRCMCFPPHQMRAVHTGDRPHQSLCRRPCCRWAAGCNHAKCSDGPSSSVHCGTPEGQE
jgi:hypothetical protein